MNMNDKINRCKYCHPSVEPHSAGFCCTANGWEDENVRKITKDDCENCEKFESKCIEYPITVQKIVNKKIDTKETDHKCGCFCEVRPCGEEYQGKSFVGVYLGQFPIMIYSSFNKKTGILKNSTLKNPAIFVPKLRKIVYGYESWWRMIQSEEDLNSVMEKDI